MALSDMYQHFAKELYMEHQDHVFIIGHKNPDTDSVCAAISYAYLKNTQSHSSRYVPCRAGQINEETEFVLRSFGHIPPRYLPNVGTQVSDIDILQNVGDFRLQFSRRKHELRFPWLDAPPGHQDSGGVKSLPSTGSISLFKAIFCRKRSCPRRKRSIMTLPRP